jgi:hypothetical protein
VLSSAAGKSAPRRGTYPGVDGVAAYDRLGPVHPGRAPQRGRPEPTLFGVVGRVTIRLTDASSSGQHVDRHLHDQVGQGRHNFHLTGARSTRRPTSSKSPPSRGRSPSPTGSTASSATPRRSCSATSTSDRHAAAEPADDHAGATPVKLTGSRPGKPLPSAWKRQGRVGQGRHCPPHRRTSDRRFRLTGLACHAASRPARSASRSMTIGISAVNTDSDATASLKGSFRVT